MFSIYMVIHDPDYEPYEIHAIFTKKEDAEAWRDKGNADHRKAYGEPKDSDDFYTLREFPVSESLNEAEPAFETRVLAERSKPA